MAMVMLITRIVLCPPMKTLSRGASPFSSRGLQLFRLLVLLPAEVVWYAFCRRPHRCAAMYRQLPRAQHFCNYMKSQVQQRSVNR